MGKPVILVELTALAWAQYLRSGTAAVAGSNYVGNTRVAINPAHTYLINGTVRRDAAANGVLYVGVNFYDASGALVGYGAYASNGLTPNTYFYNYVGTFGAGTAFPFPVGAVTMAPQFGLNVTGTAGSMDIRKCWLEDSAAAGVVISNDPQLRDPNEWLLYTGNAGTYRSDVGNTVDGTLVDTLTLRYATGTYCTAAGDTPPRTQYDARVLQPGSFSTALQAGNAGSISTSYGEIVLNNADGALGALAYHGMDGQPFRVLMGSDDAAYSTFAVVLSGTMQQVTVDRKTARVRLAGRDTLFDKPLCRTRYLGNNVLPNGLEGTASDLLGQPKPQLYGLAYNFAPPCVNTTRLIYQVSAGGVYAVDSVSDAGVALTVGADYVSQVDMETNAPAAGAFRAWPAGGYFRLGSAPTGLVTASAFGLESNLANGPTFHNVLCKIATASGLMDTADMAAGFVFGSTPVTPMNWAGSWPADMPFVGIWTRDATTTVRQAMDQIAKSVGAWYGYVNFGGLDGPFKFYSEVFPRDISGTWPSYDVSAIKSISALADPGPARGVPVYGVDVGYRNNYTVFQPSMAPSIPSSQLYWLAQKNKRTSIVDNTILNKHTTARLTSLDTLMGDDATKAGYETKRLFNALRYPRPWATVELSLQAVLEGTAKPRLGGYVTLSWPELAVIWQDGITRSSGLFSVMGMQADFVRNSLTLTVRQAIEQSI